MKFNRFVVLMLAVGFFLTAGVSQAGFLPTDPLGDGFWDQDYHWCPDALGDQAGGSAYEVFGIGWAVVGDWAYVCVETNFPEGGLDGRATPGGPTVHFYPGDLYVHVNGTFQNPGTGTVYAVGGLNNGPSQAGVAYQGATFDTGLFEGYPTGTPSDGNDGDGQNDYPTIVNGWDDLNENFGAYHHEAGPTPHGGSHAYYFAFNHTVFVDESNGQTLGTGASLQITWAMTCGNDLAEYIVEPEIPEPTTVALVGAGVAALASRRRKNIL
ncbi:MAG: PEP-CTERM sorting domain-containing protein [Candidatus Omnitrophica bacterium]|nr:PEP-CTERM sorting domain-containing protein [Candidatus Omnitrophota bacterium]MCB9767010.1 PEP-CTERM sorting domain-containing protein [Candidatus Omnitrophota bacterium]